MSFQSVNVLIFPGFEVLDVFGPVELLSKVPDVQIRMVTFGAHFQDAATTAIRSAQGTRVLADAPLRQPCDLLLVPGGVGTRSVVTDRILLDELSTAGTNTRILASVCTGSALLAAAGLLDGYRATSNKIAFDWAISQGERVSWEYSARWAHDRTRWTSSGVAAGMDMTAALISEHFGERVCADACRQAEYSPELDADNDPFAQPDYLG